MTIDCYVKVGVIGRTGAGKSSLISAMFRTGKLMGTIRIDGAATSDISLKTLRSSMSVIPQVRITELYTR